MGRRAFVPILRDLSYFLLFLFSYRRIRRKRVPRRYQARIWSAAPPDLPPNINDKQKPYHLDWPARGRCNSQNKPNVVRFFAKTSRSASFGVRSAQYYKNVSGCATIIAVRKTDDIAVLYAIVGN